jgi:hypothetical protein
MVILKIAIVCLFFFMNVMAVFVWLKEDKTVVDSPGKGIAP